MKPNNKALDIMVSEKKLFSMFHFWHQGHYFNTIGGCTLGDAKNQTRLMTLLLFFQTRRFYRCPYNAYEKLDPHPGAGLIVALGP